MRDSLPTMYAARLRMHKCWRRPGSSLTPTARKSACLTSLQQSFEAGEWHISLEDEDVHTALETRLTQSIGEAGGRLHLGRSRNDQVLTALRLYLRDAAVDLASRIDNLRTSLNELEQRQGDVELPGYTHMQHAMPSSVTLWCGGFDEAFADAVEGMHAASRRIDKNPLGSAAQTTLTYLPFGAASK